MTFPFNFFFFLIHLLFPILLGLKKNRLSQDGRAGAKRLKAVVMRRTLLGPDDSHFARASSSAHGTRESRWARQVPPAAWPHLALGLGDVLRGRPASSGRCWAFGTLERRVWKGSVRRGAPCPVALLARPSATPPYPVPSEAAGTRSGRQRARGEAGPTSAVLAGGARGLQGPDWGGPAAQVPPTWGGRAVWQHKVVS